METNPTLIFLKDGETYSICGSSFFVIGGAYSPDKEYRLTYHYPWFSDEQPSEQTKKKVDAIIGGGFRVDYVLTHTCPFRFIPFDEISGNHYTGIDYSTEEWLDSVEKKITYNKWFCGHYHIDKDDGKLVFMFDKVLLLREVP